MSTPMSPNSKLEGLELYAPRRAAKESPPDSDDSPSQMSSHISANEPPLAPDPDRGLPDTESEQTAYARADDAIQAAIGIGRSSGDPERHDSEPRLPPVGNLRLSQRESGDRPSSSFDVLPRTRHGAQFRPLRRSRLDPEIVPGPPIDTRRGIVALSLLRCSLAIGFAAIAAYGFTMMSWSHPDARLPEGASNTPGAVVAEKSALEAAREPPPQSRLVVVDQRAFANEPLPLEVAVDNATEDESLWLAGLAVGTRVSAGVSTGASSWKLPLHDLKGLYLYAPADFVGVMNTAVDLVSPEQRLIDHRGVRLEWLAKKTDPSQPVDQAGPENASPPVVQLMDRETAATLMKRGQDFLAAGDITAARIAFGRLADAGIADGAFAAAATYDPRYLAEHHVVGVLGNETKARALYQRANQLGSAEAGRVLERMVTK